MVELFRSLGKGLQALIFPFVLNMMKRTYTTMASQDKSRDETKVPELKRAVTEPRRGALSKEEKMRGIWPKISGLPEIVRCSDDKKHFMRI